MPQARVNGVGLYYHVAGRGEPLVLVHGSWGDHSSWQGVADVLAASFRVVTFDRQGHSRSERPGTGLRLDDEDDLAALLHHLEIVPAHVAGTSFGASIVLGLAARRPSLFRSLTVHEPPLLSLTRDDPQLGPAMDATQKKIDRVIERLRAGDLAGGARQFIDDVALGPGGWAALPHAVRETYKSNALTWLEEQDDPQWDELDLRALSAYSGPALLSEGDRGPAWFGLIMRRLEKGLKQAQHHVFRGAGHAPYRSHPEDYVAVVSRFLQESSA